MNPKDSLAAMRAFQEARRGNVVAAGVIRSRTAVCSACPKRKKTTGISKVSETLGRIANKHRVPREIADYSCGICGCSLLMLIPATKEFLHKDSEKEAKERPETCWVKNLDTGNASD